MFWRKPIYQPHLGEPAKSTPGKPPRWPVICKIKKVYPADANGTNPVTVDAVELQSNDPHLNIPVMSNSPRIAETPPEGILCIVAFESGYKDSAYVQGYFPGNLEKRTQVQPSSMGERREVHENGSVVIQRENGAKYQQVVENFSVVVTDTGNEDNEN